MELTLDADRSNTISNTTKDGMYLQQSSSSSISGNSIRNCGDDGGAAIDLTGPFNISVENNTLVQNLYGITINDATSLVVR